VALVFGLILRRVLQLIPIIFGVTVIAFVILNVLPGNVVYAILGAQATKQSIATLNQQLGLNHGLIYRYWQWLDGAFHGRLGYSLLSHQSVTSIIAQRAPVSLELALFAIVLALLFAVPVATLAARRPGGIADRLSLTISMIATSMPSFVLALLLILVFAVRFHLTQAVGYTPLSQGIGANLHSLILPAISLAAFPAAIYLRVLRGDIVRNLATAHFVDTARAKGLSQWKVLLGHVLPNSAFGLMTVVALNIGTVVGTAVVVEQVFALPGLGQTLVQGIYNRDSPVVQAVVVFLAIAVVGANLLADVLYIVFDPRLRHGR
jgi:peptide/nickel transport system permease protein